MNSGWVKRDLPTVINLNANDICNSKCTMCNIWQQKQGYEITPSDLRSILKDPLYREVRHVGVTGGEPTMRTDLCALYESIIQSLPKLKGVSIITNAIRQEDAIKRIAEVLEVCNNNRVSFSVMVSLDGHGKTHDQIRGRDGNFETAINVINTFKGRIPVSFGCTISKGNVWEVDELLDFVIENNLYGRFRVAEFIKRLYNFDRAEVIRNFSEDEAYHLALFFFKLEVKFERNPVYRKTYTNIRSMLLGAPRQIGCPYQKSGLVLNSRGELSYCAPRSSIVGSALEDSSTHLYRSNRGERARILKEDCESCIHDYHVPFTLKEIFQRRILKFEKQIVYGARPSVENLLFSLLSKRKCTVRKHVLIVGWYGTETVGDKAILRGVIDHYSNVLGGGNIKFSIGSLYPFVTERTCRELGVEAEVFDCNTFDLIRYAKSASITIIGGGPLMDLKELRILLTAFRVTKKYGGTNIIHGCGLGPLNYHWSRDIVKNLMQCADEIYLRDEKSVEMAKALYSQKLIKNIGDPARDYVSKFGKDFRGSRTNEVACFLRELPKEYCSPGISEEDYIVLRDKFELFVFEFIISESVRMKADFIRLYSMHNFVIGNDDRDYARYFIRKYFKGDSRVSYEKGLSTVDSIVKAMKASRLNICMRFHSVLFAHTLGTEFYAIDYTMGGKIENYLRDNDCIERLVKFSVPVHASGEM